MESERHRKKVDGVLLIDKPVGPSSNAVLQHAKRLFGATRAGHTGTLDPLASGLLVIGLGEATKFCGELLDADKVYEASLKLGERTATGDAEGRVLERREVKVAHAQLLQVLERFRGPIEQLPPMHAAIKHQGRPLYSYARSGESVPRTPRRITIYRLDLEEFGGERITLRVRCSKGTYIRVLAEDIGAALGCGAHLAALKRTGVGWFGLDGAIGMQALEVLSSAERVRLLLPSEALLGGRPRLALEAQLAAKFRQGQAVSASSGNGSVAVFAEAGQFLGTGEIDAAGVLRPKRLIASP